MANGDIDYDALPLEELERLVMADDFAVFDLSAEPPPLPDDAPLDEPELEPEPPPLPDDPSLDGQETEPELPPLPNGVPDTGAEK